MGFDLLPKTWKEVFSPDSYSKWYLMPVGILIVLGMLFAWHCIVVPYRKLSKAWRR